MGGMGEVSHLQPRKFCVSQGKMVVKCTSAGNLLDKGPLVNYC